MATKQPRTSLARHWPRFLLVLPVLLIVWVPFYNRLEPALGGIPFFYWYQLASILIGAIVVLVVYVLETRVTGTTPRNIRGADRTGTPGDML
ncbi:MAG: DUF3311 domain-containing protein [Methyloceanibacter sp.]